MEKHVKKKVVVIGGGIAGLSAGVYAQKCGFDVAVLESHAIAGGNCTSWKRGGYLFEGGMHWLAGTNEKEGWHKLWRHIGALDDGVKIHYNEPFMEFDHKGTPIRLYRNVDTTEKHLTELSPGDTKEIKTLCDNIRKVKNLAMPVPNLPRVKATKKNRPPLSLLFAAISAMGVMRAFSKISVGQYINRFSHEGIREMLRSFMDESSMGVFPLFFTMGSLARGDGGFPEGGSLPFVERIVKTFTKLGGELLCNTCADRVIVEGGKAVAVMAGDKRLSADAVIVAADTMAIDHLFDVPPKAPWLDEMRAATGPVACTFVSLGINADLKKYPERYMFKLEQPIKLVDQTYEYLGPNNYAADPAYSPAGKTAMTIHLNGDTYDFWKKARDENRYAQEKQAIAEKVIAAISSQIPEARGQIEVCDVATPLTYERYCGNWKGSWMSAMGAGRKMKTYPAVVKGIDRLYFAGQRLMPPGGLPPALATGRLAVQHLCRDTCTVFVSEE